MEYSLDDYAKWIVEHEDLKGTPEFEAVAEAYKMEAGPVGPPAPERATSAPKVSSSTDAFVRRALKVPVLGPGAFYGSDLAAGAEELLAGGAQLATRAMEPLTGTKPAQMVEDAHKAFSDRYKENYAPDDIPGTSIAKGAGMFAAAAPVSMFSPAATLGGRMLQGAKVGGGLAGLTPVENADQGFWFPKTLQVGTGAALGAAAVPVMEGAVGLVTTAANKVASWWAGREAKAIPTSEKAVDAAVAAALKTSGVDPKAVPQDIFAEIKKQATAALKAGKPLDKAAVGRVADFSMMNPPIRPTAGQVSRDPTQFAFERNIAGVQGAGEAMAARAIETNRNLIQNVSNLRPPSATADRYGAGENLIGALQGADKSMQGGINAAYTQAREAVGAGTEVPMQALAQKAGNVVETYGAENVPGVVARKLQQFGLFGGKQTKSFTVTDAEQLRQTINANYDPQNKVQAKALRELLAGVDDSIAALADSGATIGTEAAKKFAAARDLAKMRFKIIEKVPAFKAVADGDALPDKFFDQYVLRGNVTQIEGLKGLLQTRPDVLNDLRAQTIDHLQKVALAGRTPETGSFSAAAFRKELASIGDRRLQTLFSKEEIASLKRIDRAASAVMDFPPGAPVNTSKTTPALLDLISRSGVGRNIPFLGKLPANIEASKNAANVERAINPSIAGLIGREPMPFINSALDDLIRRRAGLAGSGLLGLGAGAFAPD